MFHTQQALGALSNENFTKLEFFRIIFGPESETVAIEIHPTKIGSGTITIWQHPTVSFGPAGALQKALYWFGPLHIFIPSFDTTYASEIHPLHPYIPHLYNPSLPHIHLVHDAEYGLVDPKHLHDVLQAIQAMMGQPKHEGQCILIGLTALRKLAENMPDKQLLTSCGTMEPF